MVLAHQIDIFSKPMNIKSVLSVHEEMGSGFAGCLFKEKIHKFFCLLLWKHLFILNVVPEAVLIF
jgi:hypothetical protein